MMLLELYLSVISSISHISSFFHCCCHLKSTLSVADPGGFPRFSLSVEYSYVPNLQISFSASSQLQCWSSGAHKYAQKFIDSALLQGMAKVGVAESETPLYPPLINIITASGLQKSL